MYAYFVGFNKRMNKTKVKPRPIGKIPISRDLPENLPKIQLWWRPHGCTTLSAFIHVETALSEWPVPFLQHSSSNWKIASFGIYPAPLTSFDSKRCRMRHAQYRRVPKRQIESVYSSVASIIQGIQPRKTAPEAAEFTTPNGEYFMWSIDFSITTSFLVTLVCCPYHPIDPSVLCAIVVLPYWGMPNSPANPLSSASNHTVTWANPDQGVARVLS